MSLAEDPSEISRQTARMLLQIGAIRLRPEQPFTWASGWKSPIYCDNRLSLSFPDVRTFIKRALAQLVAREHPHVEAIAGVATAGIPQGALVADALNIPFAYVRAGLDEPLVLHTMPTFYWQVREISHEQVELNWQEAGQEQKLLIDEAHLP